MRTKLKIFWALAKQMAHLQRQLKALGQELAAGMDTDSRMEAELERRFAKWHHPHRTPHKDCTVCQARS